MKFDKWIDQALREMYREGEFYPAQDGKGPAAEIGDKLITQFKAMGRPGSREGETLFQELQAYAYCLADYLMGLLNMSVREFLPEYGDLTAQQLYATVDWTSEEAWPFDESFYPEAFKSLVKLIEQMEVIRERHKSKLATHTVIGGKYYSFMPPDPEFRKDT